MVLPIGKCLSLTILECDNVCLELEILNTNSQDILGES